jgi:hypothetical protein
MKSTQCGVGDFTHIAPVPAQRRHPTIERFFCGEHAHANACDYVRQRPDVIDFRKELTFTYEGKHIPALVAHIYGCAIFLNDDGTGYITLPTRGCYAFRTIAQPTAYILASYW